VANCPRITFHHADENSLPTGRDSNTRVKSKVESAVGLKRAPAPLSILNFQLLTLMQQGFTIIATFSRHCRGSGNFNVAFPCVITATLTASLRFLVITTILRHYRHGGNPLALPNALQLPT